LCIDEVTLLAGDPASQAIQGLGADRVGIQIQKLFEGALKTPKVPVLVPDLAPEAGGYRHNRDIEWMVVRVEALPGDDHDRDVWTDLLDASHQHRRQVKIPRIGQDVDAERVVCH